jgi:hypothetical protein
VAAEPTDRPVTPDPIGGDPPAPPRPLEARGTVPPARAPVTPIRTARLIAIGADLAQLVFFPAFAGGWLSPLNNLLDVVVAVIMVRLVGWHFAFLPTFIVELVPGVDLVPTWTAAVWFATRRHHSREG